MEKTGKTGPDAAPPIEWEEKIVGKNSANPRVVKVPKGIDPGFAYNPGKAWLEPHTVPPLPEGLARLVPDTWPWPEGYKLPVVPDFHPVGANRLLDESLSNTGVVKNALEQMGATLTAPAVHISQAGYALVVGAGMFIPYGAAYNAELGDEQFKMALEGKSGRKKYMNLLVDTILDPDEIWVSWETVRTKPKFEGEKFKVMHHLKAFVITDEDGKERYMIAVFRKSRYGWDGITTFNSSDSRYFNGMRRGWLVYKNNTATAEAVFADLSGWLWPQHFYVGHAWEHYMKYVIHLQQDHLDRVLQAARREIATPQQMLENIGETLLNANHQRHAQGLAPDGSKWKELAPLTLAAKQGKGSMLVGHYPNRSGARRGGDMLSSLNYQVDGNTLTLGFDDAKAWWHHAGTDPYTIVPREKKALAFAGIARKRVRHPGLPSRKLLGFHDADKNRVGRLIDEHLNLIIRNANAD